MSPQATSARLDGFRIIKSTCHHCGAEDKHPNNVDWNCSRCGRQIYSALPDGDPVTRAKALYSLLKEMGLPDEYVSGVRWCIEELTYYENRACQAEQRADEMQAAFSRAMHELEQVEKKYADERHRRAGSIVPPWRDWGLHKP